MDRVAIDGACGLIDDAALLLLVQDINRDGCGAAQILQVRSILCAIRSSVPEAVSAMDLQVSQRSLLEATANVGEQSVGIHGHASSFDIDSSIRALLIDQATNLLLLASRSHVTCCG